MAKQQITKIEKLIHPNRLGRFEEVLHKIKDAAKVRKIDFKYEIKPAIEKPVDAVLAAAGQIRGAYQNAANKWVVMRVPVVIEHGPFDKSGFMPIAELSKMPNKDVQVIRFPTITDKEMNKLWPQIEQRAQNWFPKCDHCNPKGDKRDRFHITLLLATRDITVKTRKGNVKFKAGDISQVGSGCLEKYTDIDRKLLGDFYELDRAQRQAGKNRSPQDPAGWGWKTMDIVDYLQRCIRYFGFNEKEYFRRHGGIALAKPNAISRWGDKHLYEPASKGGIANKDGPTIFPMRKGVFLLEGRIFEYQNKFWIQPYKLDKYGIKAMLEQAKVNPALAKRVPLLDEKGVAQYDENGNPEYTLIPEMVNLPRKLFYGSGRDKKFAEILPMGSQIVTESNKIMKWLRKLDVRDMKGKEDLANNMKAILRFGYVGTKTANNATEIWRQYNLSTYNARRDAAIIAQKEKARVIREAKLSAVVGGQWYDVPSLLHNATTTFIRTLVQYDYSTREAMYDYVNNQIYLTPDDYKKFAEMEKEEANKKQRMDEAYAAKKIMSANGATWMRPPWGMNKDDMFKALSWDTHTSELNRMLVREGYGYNRGKIDRIFITQAQYQLLRDYKAGAVAQPPQAQVPPAQVVAPQAAKMDKKARISQAAAKQMGVNARSTSQFIGSKGDTLSITGYVTFISRPFRNRKFGSGRTVQVTSDGNIYVLFYFGNTVPELGQYIGLEDYKVAKHDSYMRTKQTVVEKENQPWTDLSL